jgi:KUP system potassium uptake protein
MANRTPTKAESASTTTELTAAGVLISIGIVFGDIGTSPLYTYNAILDKTAVNETIALGGVSAIFWTLLFQTTIKYVIITLRADNNGEGGIFSLYALIKRYSKWLIAPAILGASFLLADSIITPPISVTSAIEGLKIIHPGIPIIPIVLTIIIVLFLIQRAGTSFIGKLFGPIMFVWFTMIGVIGLIGVWQDPSIVKALNPVHAYDMIVHYPGGFYLLGGVFLCTTGAEALYSDLGHCGRRNIQVSWSYIQVCLVLCYLGQAHWLMQHLGKEGDTLSPFFGLVSRPLLLPAIGIATLATIIASQALISGTFTLISEAIRLNLWPKMRIIFPTDIRGQMYIPSMNYLLMVACCTVVLGFKTSDNMVAAFGLSVTITMLMTTFLITGYLYFKRTNRFLVWLLFLTYLTIEGSFLAANLQKFSHGGWVTLLLGIVYAFIMFVWYRVTNLKGSLTRYVNVQTVIPKLRELSNDDTIPLFSSNLVYLTSSTTPNKIEDKIVQSILDHQPKRALLYWFVHVEVQDNPYTTAYECDVLAPEDVIYVNLKLGFRIAPRVQLIMQKVATDMVRRKEITIQPKYCFSELTTSIGDFRFVVMQRFLSYQNELNLINTLYLNVYFLLKSISLSEEKEYSIDDSNIVLERYPLIISPPKDIALVRIP